MTFSASVLLEPFANEIQIFLVSPWIFWRLFLVYQLEFHYFTDELMWTNVDEFFLEGRLDGKGEGQLFEGGFRVFRESNYNFYLTSVIWLTIYV